MITGIVHDIIICRREKNVRLELGQNRRTRQIFMAFRGRYNSDSNSIAAAEGNIHLPSFSPQSHRQKFVKTSLISDEMISGTRRRRTDKIGGLLLLGLVRSVGRVIHCSESLETAINGVCKLRRTRERRASQLFEGTWNLVSLKWAFIRLSLVKCKFHLSWAQVSSP